MIFLLGNKLPVEISLPLQKLVYINNFSSKWRQRKRSQLKMLYAKGNTYYCNAKDQSKGKVSKAYPYPAAENPNDIKQGAQTATII